MALDPKLRAAAAPDLSFAEIELQISERDQMGHFKHVFIVKTEIQEDGTEKNIVHIINPYAEDKTVVSLESRCTLEELEEIQSELFAIRECSEILMALAEAYSFRQPIIIEGGTAIGKTYVINKFSEILFGRGTKAIDFFCSGETSVDELMGKWVPKTENSAEQAVWERYLESPEGVQALDVVRESLLGVDPERKISTLKEKLQELAKSIGLREGWQWEFKLGAIPKAMQGEYLNDGTFNYCEGGKGVMAHIQDVGHAKPAVINALFALRGEKGEHAKSIQLWQDGGRLIKTGEEFFLVFSTNPVEGYLDRNEIDKALARGVIYLKLGDLSNESIEHAADKIVYEELEKFLDPTKTSWLNSELNARSLSEIASEMSGVLGQFHIIANQSLRNGEANRMQQIPLTIDDLSRAVKSALYFPVCKDGEPKLQNSIRRAVHRIYINRLADEELKAELKDVLDTLINEGVSILDSDENKAKSGSKQDNKGSLTALSRTPETDTEFDAMLRDAIQEEYNELFKKEQEDEELK